MHKPGCICRVCAAARRRTQTAIIEPTGDGGTALVTIDVAPPATVHDATVSNPINADQILVAPSKTIRDRVAQWIILRSQGLKNAEIASRLGIQTGTLNTMISKAAKQGWLKMESPAERLEYELAPTVVDNLKEFLDEKDKKITVEVAKGIGLFKSHQAVKVEGDVNKAILALNIEFSGESAGRKGNIVGTPNVIDVEVVQSE